MEFYKNSVSQHVPDSESIIIQSIMSSANLQGVEGKPIMVKIIKSQTSSEGWAIVDNEVITDLTAKNRYIDKRHPDNLYYHLPQNSANRAYISAEKLEDGLVLEYKESHPTGSRASNVVRKDLSEYMTKEEKALQSKYETMIETVKARKYSAEHKVLTPLEKIEFQIKKLEEQKRKLELENIAKSNNVS